jgi:catechol 2,3-dioxygenase
MIRPQMIGHVHIKVRDLERAERFYTNLLGFSVTERVAGRYVFLTAGERHHDLALQYVGPDAPGPVARGVGLYHFAIELADRAALIDAARTLRAADVPAHLVNHGISLALYFADPDGNGIELYIDTREQRALWQGVDDPVDQALLAALA